MTEMDLALEQVRRAAIREAAVQQARAGGTVVSFMGLTPGQITYLLWFWRNQRRAIGADADTVPEK